MVVAILTADVDDEFLELEDVIVVVITVPIEIVEMDVVVTSAVAPAVAAISPAVVAIFSVDLAVVATSSVACISARIILVLFEYLNFVKYLSNLFIRCPMQMPFKLPKWLAVLQELLNKSTFNDTSSFSNVGISKC